MTQTTYAARMSDADTVLWKLGADPGLRSTVLTVIELDAVPDPERLRHAVERTIRAVPRFRQRVVPDPLGLATPRWEIDPHFDLDFHVRRVSLPDGSIDDVLSLGSSMAMQSFDPARPLWEWLFVEGLATGGAAMIGKVHHSVTDGVGGVDMAMNFFDLEATPVLKVLPEPVGERGADHVLSGALHEAQVLGGAARAGLDAGLRGLKALLTAPRSSLGTVDATARAVVRAMSGGAPLSELMSSRSLSLRFATLQLDLDELRAAAKTNGVKINDIALAATAAGVGDYHRRQGFPVDTLRFSMMVNTRSEAEAATSGNNFTGVRLELSAGELDGAMLQGVRAAAVAAANDPIVSVAKPLLGATRRMPLPLTLPLVGAVQRSVDVISSNVPGWPIPVYLGGAKVLRVLPLGPLAGSALNVTLLSHERTVNVGITADPAAVTDVTLLVRCLEDAFARAVALGAAKCEVESAEQAIELVVFEDQAS
jgi:WS/DGAT/MGAT family acyltransferase